jgi:phage terminase small subunit
MSRPAIESIELGEAMEALSPKERLFVAELFQGSNGAAAARAAGYGAADGSSTNKTLARIAFRLRSRASVVRAIVEESQRTVKSLGPEAIAGMRQIIGDKKNRDRGKMIRFVLDKIDPALMLHQHQHQHDVTLRVDHEAETIKALRWFRDVKVPREVLVEYFGHTGLSRYERMLAEQDQKKLTGPVIEASPAPAEPPGAVTSVRRFRVGEPDTG